MSKKPISTLTNIFIVSAFCIFWFLSSSQLQTVLNSPGVISLTYQLAIAYVITFGFYYITVYLKERRDSNNINEYVIPKSKNIIGDGYSIFQELAKKAGMPNATFPPSEEQLKSILEKISAQMNDAPMVNFDGSRLTWPQYLNSQRMRSQDFIRKILDRMPYINTDLIKIITRIDDCSYFGQLSMLILIPLMSNSDMSFISRTLHDYFIEIDTLEKFIEQNYGKTTKYHDLFPGY